MGVGDLEGVAQVLQDAGNLHLHLAPPFEGWVDLTVDVLQHGR